MLLSTRAMSAACALLTTVAPGTANAATQDTPRKTGITVFAAASLTDALGELGALFERQQPGVTVRFNFAGSQQLAVQLEQGARADVLATADERWMRYVAERSLLTGEPVTFAHNRLVVIVPRTNPGRIERLQDLARPGVKIVLAAEAVPAGTYSREALSKLAGAPGFPAGYRDRVLANVVSHEESVRAAAAKVQLGESDAAIVYWSDITRAMSPHVRVLEIPDASNVVARYPVAALRGAPLPDLASAFITLLRSPAGLEVLRRHGLLAPITAR